MSSTQLQQPSFNLQGHNMGLCLGRSTYCTVGEQLIHQIQFLESEVRLHTVCLEHKKEDKIGYAFQDGFFDRQFLMRGPCFDKEKPVEYVLDCNMTLSVIEQKLMDARLIESSEQFEKFRDGICLAINQARKHHRHQ